MKRVKFNFKEAEVLGRSLSCDYKIFAPVKKVNKGKFSETDLITYDYVKTFSEIEFFEKTHYSAKEVIFPVRQTLFEFRDDGTIEGEEKVPPTIVFLRSCDIAALGVMDSHFLGGEFSDIHYQRRREKLKIFLIECVLPFENCFCVSMGTNLTDNYDAFIRKTDEGFEVKINDIEMERYFDGGIETNVTPKFVEQDLNPLSLPEEIDVSLFSSEMWQEYSRRCIACGRCNTSCPTCTCWTMQDILSENGEDESERRRIWSSCQVKKFSLLSGGHDFRAPKGDRMRYKVLHKIIDFRKRAGFNMCVGCGRCEDVCPEYISMARCIEKINAVNGAL